MYHKMFDKIKRDIKTFNVFETFNLLQKREREKKNTVCTRVYIRRLYTMPQRSSLKHLTAG